MCEVSCSRADPTILTGVAVAAVAAEHDLVNKQSRTVDKQFTDVS